MDAMAMMSADKPPAPLGSLALKVSAQTPGAESSSGGQEVGWWHRG